MIKIEKDEFHNIVKTGVYVFLNNSECPLCSIYKKRLTQYSTKKWNYVDLSSDKDYKVFMEENKIDGFPETRLYFNNEIKWSKTGVLFDLQMKEIYRAIADLYDLELKNTEVVSD